jgi:preprotein translocase subunit YajC
MGNIDLAATATKTSGSSLLPIIIIVVLFMLVYMTMTRRSRARRAQQMQTTIVPGTRVRTTSGMYGTITSVEGDDVMVEVAPGVQIRMMARAVVPVPQDASTGEPPQASDSDFDTGDTSANGSSASTNGSGSADSDAEGWEPQDRNV